MRARKPPSLMRASFVPGAKAYRASDKVCNARSRGSARLASAKSFPINDLQIDARDDDVAAQDTGRFVHAGKCGAQEIERFLREKSDLTLVVLLEVEKTIAANAVSGDAFDSIDFLQMIIVRFASMMAKIIVAGRNENLMDITTRNVQRSTLNVQRPIEEMSDHRGMSSVVGRWTLNVGR